MRHSADTFSTQKLSSGAKAQLSAARYAGAEAPAS
jgi:hypothetical protein